MEDGPDLHQDHGHRSPNRNAPEPFGDGDGGIHMPQDWNGSPLSTALQPSRGRKRKGSLRKGILGKMMQRNPVPDIGGEASVDHTNRLERAEGSQLNDGHGAQSRLHLSDRTYDLTTTTALHISGPIATYVTRADKDDTALLQQPSASSSSSSVNVLDLTETSTATLSRRAFPRSTQHRTSTPADEFTDVSPDEGWDYSETEKWGWIILVATWILFVVVMGSCLGVWSWAWNVGETPHAVPDLQDDATLPIAGYYPALMVCTAVMAWIWVVVAWVGMKYFRHAKVAIDDG